MKKLSYGVVIILICVIARVRGLQPLLLTGFQLGFPSNNFIQPGCISKCGNEYFDCEVTDCSNEEVIYGDDTSFPDRPYFPDDVHWYTHYNGRYQLAFNVSWHIANMKHKVGGFKIQVVGPKGQQLKELCYLLKENYTMVDVAKTRFHYDCFGKGASQHVNYSSEYKVKVYTLPISRKNSVPGVVTINTPSCPKAHGHQDLCTDAKPCKDCSTHSTGHNDGLKYAVGCSINQCQITGEKIDITGSPSSPRRIAKDKEWYIYPDRYDGKMKLALNFSWGPPNDASIKYLRGFRFEIIDLGTASTRIYAKCYNISTSLEYFKHSNTEFFHDCYGLNAFAVSVDRRYTIHITSLPQSTSGEDMSLTFRIQTPSCTDPRLKGVEICKDPGVLNATVDDIYCYNNSLKLTYEVAPTYGSSAAIVLCEKRDSKIKPCKFLGIQKNLPLKATLYNVTLPTKPTNFSVEYFVFVYGNERGELREMTTPITFKECAVSLTIPTATVPSDVTKEAKIIIGVVVTCGIILIALLVLCIFRKTRLSHIKNLRKSAQKTEKNGNYLHINGSEIKKDSQKKELSAAALKNTRIFVIYTEDNKLHLDVVHWFCSYLKSDLGMDVRTYLWEKNEADLNPVPWMMKNLEEAEKVIVLCSAGANNSINNPNNTKNRFHPIVKKIIDDTFFERAPGKHLIGYFDYSSTNDIPSILREQSDKYCSQFKLMKQFESMYLRLTENEQSVDGKVNRNEKIALESFDKTSSGRTLKTAIENMVAYVEKNPTWFTDEHGEDAPVAAVPTFMEKSTSDKERANIQSVRPKIPIENISPTQTVEKEDNYSTLSSSPSSLNEDVFTYDVDVPPCNKPAKSYIPHSSKSMLIPESPAEEEKIKDFNYCVNKPVNSGKSPSSSNPDSGLFDMEFESQPGKPIQNVTSINQKHNNPQCEAQESGVFTLAPLNELEEENIEDAFASINLSSSLQC